MYQHFLRPPRPGDTNTQNTASLCSEGIIIQFRVWKSIWWLGNESEWLFPSCCCLGKPVVSGVISSPVCPSGGWSGPTQRRFQPSQRPFVTCTHVALAHSLSLTALYNSCEVVEREHDMYMVCSPRWGSPSVVPPICACGYNVFFLPGLLSGAFLYFMHSGVERKVQQQRIKDHLSWWRPRHSHLRLPHVTIHKEAWGGDHRRCLLDLYSWWWFFDFIL